MLFISGPVEERQARQSHRRCGPTISSPRGAAHVSIKLRAGTHKRRLPVKRSPDNCRSGTCKSARGTILAGRRSRPSPAARPTARASFFPLCQRGQRRSGTIVDRTFREASSGDLSSSRESQKRRSSCFCLKWPPSKANVYHLRPRKGYLMSLSALVARAKLICASFLSDVRQKRDRLFRADVRKHVR